MTRTARDEPRRARRGKDDAIRIRASAEIKATWAEIKAMLNRAAGLRGQRLPEFILESARRQAEEAILDQCSFFLDPEAHERFLAMLDAPASPNKQLRALMRRRPSWER